MSEVEDEYIKEGDLILVQIKKEISEVVVKDLSPSGNYMRVTTPAGHNSVWLNTIHYVETLVSEEDDGTEYVDVGVETAQDILAKIRNRVKEFDADEEIESEIIQIDKFAELDLRNNKK